MAHSISSPIFAAPVSNKFHFAGLTNLLALARQRRQLAKLDAHILEDIGVSHKAASAEAHKPFWVVSGYQFS